MTENPRLLLTSGPQFFDGQTPHSSSIRRIMEHFDPLSIGIMTALIIEYYGNNASVKWHELSPTNQRITEREVSQADLILSTARHYDHRLTNEVVQMARSLNKPIAIGGASAILEPQVYDDWATICQGEAEIILHQLLSDFRSNGKLKPKYKTEEFTDMWNNYTNPNREIYAHQVQKYGKYYKHSIELQRGCKNMCSFCAAVRIQGHGTRNRNPDDVIREIESLKLKPGSHIMFPDLNISVAGREILYPIFKHLKKNGIRYFMEGTVKELIDDYQDYPNDSLLKLMSPERDTQGGCYSMLYGAEDVDIKKVNGSRDKSVETTRDAVRLFQLFGIPLNISLIIGLPEHKFPDSIFEYAKFIHETLPTHAFIFIATPYKGTPYGDKMYKDKQVFDTNPMHHNHRRAVSHHSHFSDNELQQGYYWLQRQITDLSHLKKIAQSNLRNPSLSQIELNAIQAGIPFGIETKLSLMELNLRGYIDHNFQKKLDQDYKKYCA